MSQQEEGMWYPQLPEGYPGHQYEVYQQNRPSSPAQQGWPGAGYHGQPSQQPAQPSWPWQYPGYPSQPSYPGYPGQTGYPSGSPGYPSYPMTPVYPGYHEPHGHHGHSGSPAGSAQQGPPTSAPPNQTPSYPETNLRAVDPGGIAGCLYRYTYIWTSRHKGFWYYPTFVGRTSIAGYRWDPRHYRWEYYGLDLKYVDSFTCT
ncbi:hypothetical protein DV702_08325 [Sporosarcina sp. PTS2304]|uniref:hypothetical protein n=1 Tax=Sporosarcina sp. PTS2304 TaxID=2283194 RepID=UPI000E0D1E88|nr:hypothetical protein [Sporosarcina sp. PTS2304]AXH99736.1 hypothetical protein DV702_08325 [Sporosarcina sp. PTS2304]